jgi:GT2 family glycosyltransferase/ubiquinone/menaquinone biosynthesis C-methylase UbiE
MPNQQPVVSIIIPHTAGTEILIDCLDSLARGCGEPKAEIILVDNASSDGSVAEAFERFPEIRVLRLEENQGYAGGCNRGIEAANGRYVLLLNDDTEVDAACVRELVETAEADPTVGACQPKIRALRDRSQFEYSGAAGGLMDVYGYPFSRGRIMDHVEADEGQYDEPAEIFWASGVCMLIRKSVLDEVGAFDETFFAYMEEIDLSWRINLGGYCVVYVPTALVYHIGGYSLERKNVKRMYLNHRNSVIMLAKNYSLRSLVWAFPVKIVLELFIFAGALLRNPLRSRAVMLSFGWLLTHVPLILRLRAETQEVRRVPDRLILSRLYQGMAPIWYFLFGIRQVTDLPDVETVLHQPYRRNRLARRSGTVRPRRRNFFYAYLDQAPVSLALMRAIECDHFSQLPFERPVLDVGCGGGTFARILFNGVTVDAGVDRDSEQVERARAMRCFDELEVAKVERLPFESERFATVFSNHVLEHVDDIDAALNEVHRVLKPGGAFYLTVPNTRCTTHLLWSGVFRRIGLVRLAEWYSNFTLRLFRVKRVLPEEEWSQLLENFGFAVERCELYMPLKATRIQDALLPPAVFSMVSKALFGREVLFPRLHRVRVRLYRRFLRGAYEERSDDGSSTLLVARRPLRGEA